MMFCGKYSTGSLAMSVGRLLSAVVAAAMLLAACSEKGLDTENVPRKFKNRTDAPRSRKVLLLYSIKKIRSKVKKIILVLKLL